MPVLIPLSFTLLISWLMTISIERLCQRWSLMDMPGERKIHTQPVPRMGGLSFFVLPTLAAVLWSLDVPLEIGAGALIAFAGGLYDDLRPANSASVKLMFQIPAALVFAALVPLYELGLSPSLAFTCRFVAFGFVLFVTNAANLMDNMNGLTSGLALIVLFPLVLMAYFLESTLQWPLIFLAVTVLGFYVRNFPAGHIYMGDQGSQLLGFTLSAAAVSLVPHALGNQGVEMFGKTLLVLFALFGLFIADVVCVVVTRLRLRKPVWQGDQNHLSHRLARTGLGPVKAVVILSLGQGALALLSLALIWFLAG